MPQPDPDRERAELRAEAGPRATTPNGAPFPLRSWPPDAAIDIQNLANWADPLKWTGAAIFPGNGFDLNFRVIRLLGGQQPFTTDSSGFATLTFTPAFSAIYGILLTAVGEGAAPYMFRTANGGLLNASCRFSCMKHDGAALVSTAINVAWLAWGTP